MTAARPHRQSSLGAGLLVAALTVGWVAVLTTVLVDVVGRIPGGPSGSWVVGGALLVGLSTAEPVRRWLDRGVDQAVVGHHDDAYDALTWVQRELDGASLADTIALAARLPYVEIVTTDGLRECAGRPVPGTEPVAVPLVYRGERVGDLAVGARRRGSPLSPADLRLLGDLAGQVAVSVVAQRAARSVQESRAALVTAREEERRRIRRDLHDGLGPTLASLHLQLAAARRLLPGEPVRVAEVVDGLLEDVRSATGEVRRLVYGLRPPLLDELGLAGALSSLARAQDRPVHVRTSADLGVLPAAVEVALYRIAAEALRNVVVHSAAASAQVVVTRAAGLARLVVTDDGRGLPRPLLPGVGLTAMRERVAELGGELRVDTRPAGGTEVVAELPLREAAG